MLFPHFNSYNDMKPAVVLSFCINTINTS